MATSLQTAISALTNAGFVVSQPVSYAWSGTVAKGNVISQVPAAGSSATPGTPVFLTVSRGVAPTSGTVAVPSVVGLTWQAAFGALESAGVTTPGTPGYVSSGTVASGVVLSQGIAAGTQVAVGTSVSLVVSSGNVPNWYSASQITVPAVT